MNSSVSPETKIIREVKMDLSDLGVEMPKAKSEKEVEIEKRVIWLESQVKGIEVYTSEMRRNSREWKVDGEVGATAISQCREK